MPIKRQPNEEPSKMIFCNDDDSIRMTSEQLILRLEQAIDLLHGIADAAREADGISCGDIQKVEMWLKEVNHV